MKRFIHVLGTHLVLKLCCMRASSWCPYLNPCFSQLYASTSFDVILAFILCHLDTQRLQSALLVILLLGFKYKMEVFELPLVFCLVPPLPIGVVVHHRFFFRTQHISEPPPTLYYQHHCIWFMLSLVNPCGTWNPTFNRHFVYPHPRIKIQRLCKFCPNFQNIYEHVNWLVIYM